MASKIKTVLFTWFLICATVLYLGQACAKDSVATFTGELQIVVADDFKNKKAVYFYSLREDGSGKTYRIKFSKPSDRTQLISSKVKLQGKLVGDDEIIVESPNSPSIERISTI